MPDSSPLPNAIALLQTITSHLETIKDILVNKDHTTDHLKEIITTNTYINQEAAFTQNQPFVYFLQLSMLLGLSMYGGMYIPCIKSFSA